MGITTIAITSITTGNITSVVIAFTRDLNTTATS